MKAEQKKILEGLDFSEISISSSITLTDAAVPAAPLLYGCSGHRHCQSNLPKARSVSVAGRFWVRLESMLIIRCLCNRCHDAVVFLGKKAA